jgi:hypothetical protein
VSRNRSEHFSTAFDPLVPALDPPAEVTSGTDPVIRTVDGFTRGVGIVGRFTTSPGMLALKVAAEGIPVRVDILVRLDRVGARWWHSRVPAKEQPRSHGPRLLVLSSQGSVRAAALLARRGQFSRTPARAWLRFELLPGEVFDNGLLILDFQEASFNLPTWAPPLTPHSVVGVALMRVEVTPIPRRVERHRKLPVLDTATCERWGLLSTGDLPEIDAHGKRLLSGHAFVVNPPPADLRMEQDGWLLIDVDAELQGRAEAALPYPVAEVLAGGPIGRARERVSRIAQRLKPLRVAAARELRRELNLPRIAAAVERSASARHADLESLLAALQTRGVLRAVAMRLPDGSPEPINWVTAADGHTQLRISSGVSEPVLIQLGVEEEKAQSILRGGRIRWTVNSVRSTVDQLSIPLAGRGSASS